MSEPQDQLPEVLTQFARRHPEVWKAYNALGNAVAQAGPLDEKTQRLVKLAIAIGAGRTGAVHSHVRRAVAEGLTPEEILQVGILAIPTIGWPGAFAAITWIEDELPSAQQDLKQPDD